MLTFEIPAVKCRHGVEVNWSRYQDTGVTDPALVKIFTLSLQITSQEITNLDTTASSYSCHEVTILDTTAYSNKNVFE